MTSTNIPSVSTLPPAIQQAFQTKEKTGPDNSLGKDAFLKLLIAQLKYQDPMKPAEGAEFIAQTAQFTMVEKLEDLKTQNAEAFSMQKSLQAAGLVGRQVTYKDELGKPATGIVTSVKIDPTGPILRVGTTDVALGKVTEVTDSRPSGTAGASTGTSASPSATGERTTGS